MDLRLTDSDIFTALLPEWQRSSLWFKQEAARALSLGHYRFIHGRSDRDVYLVRCWLTEPTRIAVSGEEEIFSSSNAVMLHFFPRADDDRCLHNHPWNYRTTILAGGYTECLPPRTWDPKSYLGPAWDQNLVTRVTGETIDNATGGLHCVGSVLPDTWTLVRTSPKVRSWGFHPEGKPFAPWREYLESLKVKIDL